MRINRSLLSAFIASLPTATTAFSAPRVTSLSRARAPAFVSANARSFHSSSNLQMANVMRLSDPQEDLLKDVDVFIFDCDGVIWRVSNMDGFFHAGNIV